MKKLILALLMIGVVQFGMAQKSPTEKLFEKYNGQDGFTTIHISQELFGLFSDIDAENDEEMAEVKDMMSQLNYIRILMYDVKDGNRAEMEEFKKEMDNFDLEGFTELMVVKEKDEEVRFLITKKGDRISELLLIISEDGEAGFISITGDIDINTVSKLSKTMGLEGMEKLEKLHDDGD